jgi:hypothetical protein
MALSFWLVFNIALACAAGAVTMDLFSLTQQLFFDPIDNEIGYEFCSFIGGYGFIEENPIETRVFNGSEDGITDKSRRQVVADFSSGNAFIDNAYDDTIELLDEAIGLTLEISFGISNLQEDDPGEYPVVCIAFDTRPDNFFQFVESPVYSLQIPVYLYQKLLVMFCEDMIEEISSVLEIFVNQSFGDSGCGSDFSNSD